jgi:hypothetical protein
MAKGKPVVDLMEHFLSKVIPDYEDDHWSLDAFLNNKGYHTISIGGGRKAYGHVVAYELFVGPVPEGWDVDHQCDTPWCCNPDHLKAMTHSDNIRRAYQLCGAKLHDMTDPDNIYYRPKGTGRMCRACIRRRNRNRKT